MSRGTAKKAKELEAQPQFIFDAKRDINPFWRSSLFSDVYLKNDVPREYKHLWENDEIGGFHDFYQGFVDLCVETEHETFEKWKEADTVKNWIVHVMDLLGWENNSERRSNSYMDNESFTVIENGRKQTFRPDLVYFDKPKHKSYTQKEKDIDRKLSEARNKRTGTRIVVEAKYWDRLSHIAEQSKKDAKINDSASALGPELQTLKYMEIFDHDFGILTDGKTWRLFHKDLSQGVDRRSFDFDLGNLRELALDLDSYQNEEKFSHYAKYFYYFFSKSSLIQSEETKTAPLVYEIFEYSKKYAHSIEEDLKKRFIITMTSTCNALKESCEDTGEEVDLDTIRNVSESHLFNILFVKSCEVRRILPISSTQYLRLSLHEVVETMDAMNFDPDKDWDDFLRDFKFSLGKKFDWDGYELFNRFINLYEIIHDGTAKSKDFGFEVEGFKESIFTKPEWKFAKTHKINNKRMVEILFNLSFIESSFKGRKYQQIPYSYFTPRQLGSIYESFLEYRLETAESDLIFSKGKWSKANLSSRKVKGLKLVDSHIAKKGELFFSPDNEDRKITGSFYTPDHVVKYIVENTLGEKLESLSSDELLKLRVCDPAMGSGHFLAGAIDYLVNEYRSKWSSENNDDLNESVEESSRKILHSCIYGKDINERAVKLARMSLWLITAYPGKKLENLKDQLEVCNSLYLDKKTKKDKFDFVIGNPPYVQLAMMNYYNEDLANYLKDSYSSSMGRLNTFGFFIEKSLKDLVNDNGSVGFIIPNTVLTQDYYEGLRLQILEKGLKRIANFNGLVFKDAVVETTVLIIGKNKKDVVVELVDAQSGKSIESKNISKDNIIGERKSSFNINFDEKLDGFKDILNESSIELNKIVNINQAIAIKGGKDKFIFDKQKKGYYPLVEGKDIGRYRIKNKSGKYLKYDLSAIHSCKRKDIFESDEKLFFRRVGSNLMFAYDNQQYFALNTLIAVNIKEGVDYSLKFILGLLNSKTFDLYYQTFLKSSKKVFSEIQARQVGMLPIPKLDNAKAKKFHEKIVGLVEKVLKSSGEKSLKIEEEIDKEIQKFYGINLVDFKDEVVVEEAVKAA
jgi:hypothetical protein